MLLLDIPGNLLIIIHSILKDRTQLNFSLIFTLIVKLLLIYLKSFFFGGGGVWFFVQNIINILISFEFINQPCIDILHFIDNKVWSWYLLRRFNNLAMDVVILTCTTFDITALFTVYLCASWFLQVYLLKIFPTLMSIRSFV